MALPPWLNDYVKPIDPGPVITAALGLLVTGAGVFFTFLISKKKAKSDVQTTLNDGFTKLIDEFQEERIEMRKQIREMQTELAEATRRIRELETVMREHDIPIPN